MAKNLKIKIKNTQLANVAGLKNLKPKLDQKPKAKEKLEPEVPSVESDEDKIDKPRIRAKSRSAFAPKEELETKATAEPEPKVKEESKAAVEPLEVADKKEELKEPIKFMKLGPTGRHVKDLLPKKRVEEPKKVEKPKPRVERERPVVNKPQSTPTIEASPASDSGEADAQKGNKVRDFRDLKPARRGQQQPMRAFDARDRAGLSAGDEERWRKRRGSKMRSNRPDYEIVRPTSLLIRLPIQLKDLAYEMKLKASEIIQKLFLSGMTFTMNDYLDDETTVQFIGSEFGCEIKIDTSEEERLRVTRESVREEIAKVNPENLKLRPPVVAFMGHVDHGKTSLIDAIRKSNIASGEAGAITQHIGAFKCRTAVGELTVLDTPGHEAFFAMRARGAEVTDIVVLVVAGDEGMREQTNEALQHAKEAGVTIVVAINKCDKPNFNADNVYRQLAEKQLLPEAWGGQTITVNTSAVTGEGISTLLEMLALQAEVLELRAEPTARARGVVLESELHKGLGCVATILVQNGTLKQGDALVFESHFGRVKTMHDEHNKILTEAGPSTPVELTGLSGLPKAGDPFIVVANEKEAQHIIESRQVGREHLALQVRKSPALETFLLASEKKPKKILKLVIRGDVQGSVEALKTSIMKIASEKAQVDIIFAAVGEISESDVQLAAASNAVILGFHTKVESHAEGLIKEYAVKVRLFDIIYHAVDDVKALMTSLLDKVSEERSVGEATVQAIFKSSQLGKIAGCIVTEGLVARKHHARVLRNGQVVWKGSISSLKRIKEDVKEVKKGLECGIVLDGYSEVQEGDIIQTYEIIYLAQEL